MVVSPEVEFGRSGAKARVECTQAIVLFDTTQGIRRLFLGIIAIGFQICLW